MAESTHKSEKAECIYQFVKTFSGEWGFAPTYRQIANACGIASTGSVNYYLRKLQAAGRVRLEPGASRAIVILGSDGEAGEREA